MDFCVQFYPNDEKQQGRLYDSLTGEAAENMNHFLDLVHHELGGDEFFTSNSMSQEQQIQSYFGEAGKSRGLQHGCVMFHFQQYHSRAPASISVRVLTPYKTHTSTLSLSPYLFFSFSQTK